MSTRAIYAFTDSEIHNDDDTYYVYKHCDGYPQGSHGALASIAKAIPIAFPLPRFEADEFAASFVAANKMPSGSIRLMNKYEPDPLWIDYLYSVQLTDEQLFVTIYKSINSKRYAIYDKGYLQDLLVKYEAK